MKPFLILQARPETEAADDEFDALLRKSGLAASAVVRVRLDREDLRPDLELDQFSGVIVGGGPGCVSDVEKPAVEQRIEDSVLGLLPAITEGDVPFMGCCYGLGVLAHHLGGAVSKERYGEEVGPVECSVTQAGRGDALTADFPDTFSAFVGHKEAVQALPDGCAHLLSSAPCPFQMIRYKNNVYATQFHPEADGDVFETRIRLYKNKGYFRPEDAERLIAQCRAAEVTVPERVLSRFVERYRR